MLDSAVMSEAERSLPDIDFTTFILSLGSNVLVHLGEMADPDSGKTTKNLPLARQTIDILSMLQEKTKNNLSDVESQLLGSLLYDLRVKYVDAGTGKKGR